MGCEKIAQIIYKIQIKFQPKVKEISKFEFIFCLQFVALINGCRGEEKLCWILASNLVKI